MTRNHSLFSIEVFYRKVRKTFFRLDCDLHNSPVTELPLAAAKERGEGRAAREGSQHRQPEDLPGPPAMEGKDKSVGRYPSMVGLNRAMGIIRDFVEYLRVQWYRCILFVKFVRYLGHLL